MEVEVKFPVSEGEAEAVRAKLRGLGLSARAVSQFDVYFSPPPGAEGVVRLRREGRRVVLTYKGPKLPHDLKVREEVEVEVSDFDRARAILERLGLREVGVVRKVREEYELGSVKVSLDVVEGLGSFIEVEAVGDDVEAAAARVKRAAAMLGLDSRRALTATYLELLACAQQS